MVIWYIKIYGYLIYLNLWLSDIFKHIAIIKLNLWLFNIFKPIAIIK